MITLQTKTSKPMMILVVLATIVFLIYYAYVTGYSLGHEQGWHDSLEYLRVQSGDIVYPADVADIYSDKGILLDDMDYAYSPFHTDK